MRYYSTQRPVMPGSFPKKEAVERIENFDTKTFCEQIGQEAWGFIEYKEPLEEGEADAYSLVFEGTKPYWCVTTSIDDRGRVVANITGKINAACKPENAFTRTSRRDIYRDWFGSYEEAEEFVREAKEA